jgi:F0F1-type ATP synthase delta subunit
MKQPRHKLAQAIADKTLDKGVNKAYSRKVAAYLLSERRVSELDSILRDVQSDWAEAGHVEVIAESAHPLTPAIRKDITAQIKRVYPKAQEIVINEVLDESVIGGVRLSLAHDQLDLSVEHKLDTFKQLTTERTA